MDTQRLSLRSGFVWTAAGNLVNAATQWLVLALLARAGSAELLGQWALALALSAPVAMMAHLNLRTLLATDVAGEHPFTDYLRVRHLSNAAAIAVLLAIALHAGWPVLLLGCAILTDNTSDVLYGAMQRAERLDSVAQSMMTRSLLSVALVGAALLFRADALSASAGYLSGRLITLCLIDWPRSRDSMPAQPARRPWKVLLTSLPLGFSLLLISLSVNVPRYAIERHGGSRELGAFAAVTAFVAAGTTVVNALGQSATTRLAAAFQTGNRPAFRKLTFSLLLSVVVIGGLGVLLAELAGGSILALIYSPAFAAHAPLLVACLAAGVALWVAQALGFAASAMRAFKPQLPVLAAMCAVSALVSFGAVPRWGLYGAAMAMAASGLAGAAGQLAILRRAL